MEMDWQKIVSIVSSVIFLAGSVISLYVGGRISKIENKMMDEVEKKIEKATGDKVTYREFQNEMNHIRELIKRNGHTRSS